MKKTAIAKITAKITATALLFFLLLFTLTTCLVAQESGQTRKQGWFVGVSPYFLGASTSCVIFVGVVVSLVLLSDCSAP